MACADRRSHRYLRCLRVHALANSAASKNVHKEVILAQDSLIRPTYVVMLEVVRLPAEIRYQLAGLQFINYPLLGFEKSSSQLVDAVKPHLKKTVPDGDGSQKQTELVIQGVDLSAFTAEKQEQLLAFISNWPIQMLLN